MTETTAKSSDGFSTQDIEGLFLLSPTQAGMLYHSLSAPGVYFEQSILRIDGELDVEVLRNAWQRIVDHHEVLRTSFSWDDPEKPVQIAHRRVILPFAEHDWRELKQTEQDNRLEVFVRDDRDAGFDFAKPPLMRFALIRLTDDSYRLIWSHHHALLDGWSQSLVLRQVFTLYDALAKGEAASLPPSTSYREYIEWLAKQDLRDAENFWRKSLSGFTAPTSLGAGRVSSDSHDEVLEHGELTLRLSSEFHTELQAFARKHRLTSFTLMLGAWALLLSRYSGTDDVLFGTTVSVRPHELPDIESAAGLFINTIPVRTQLDSKSDALSWLKDLQTEAVEMREHQHASLIDIQGWSDVPRGLPLFESILIF